MSSFFASNQKNVDRATLLLRLVLAAVFIAHGYQKVFVFGFAGVTASFIQMGVPLPTLVAPVICVLELLGGVMLLAGAFARVAAALLACDMLGAILIVHGKNGFFAPKGVEFVLDNLCMLLAIVLLGAGAYSIDAMLARRNAPTP